jgi:hypothetical protein
MNIERMATWENRQARKLRLVLGILCAIFAANNAAAAAQTPGQHIDPGGPAGYEYSLPSGDALDQTGAAPPQGGPGEPPGGAAGGGAEPSLPGADPRLFGVGVEPARNGRRDRSASPSAGSTRPSGEQPGASTDRARPAEPAASRWDELSQDGSGSPIWLLSAVAVAVVGAAGALAFGLRRPRVSGP